MKCIAPLIDLKGFAAMRKGNVFFYMFLLTVNHSRQAFYLHHTRPTVVSQVIHHHSLFAPSKRHLNANSVAMVAIILPVLAIGQHLSAVEDGEKKGRGQKSGAHGHPKLPD